MSTPTEPYSPPDDWVIALARVPDLNEPRLVVSLSAGRAAYKPLIDVRPTVTRVEVDGAEVVSLDLAEYQSGDAFDVATSIYADVCAQFLAMRRADGAAHVRSGRIRLQVLDGTTEIVQHSHGVAREAFDVDASELHEFQPSGAPGIQTDALRVMADHSRMVTQSFLTLAKQTNDNLAREREGVLTYTKGAIEVIQEVSDQRATMLAEQAEQAMRGSLLDSEAGQHLISEIAGALPDFIKMLSHWLASRGPKVGAA